MAEEAVNLGKFNVAFEAFFMLAEPDNCIDVLVKAKRVAEATMFAKAYAPSRLPELISKWGDALKEAGLQFSPENICETQSHQVEEDLVKEKRLRNEIYDQIRKEASAFEEVK